MRAKLKYMTRQELQSIYSRFYNSPAPIRIFDPDRFNDNLAKSRKPSRRFGTVIHDSSRLGTFKGSLRDTYGFRKVKK